ncbi:serine/threonine-protein kinase [Catenulispora subtropica]|uniref:Protein kinase domain-containing protein n=1 Tax=Catenulispora subtropica TaxID=450798 RepID=A0ABP5D8I4_9ACTN
MKPLGPSDPRQVGPYRVFGELGRGGMGRVLLAGGRDGRLVALKLVHAQHVEDPGFRERFRREVNASRRVSGAYTAAVVDADAEAELPWLATVFVPGPSLREAVDSGGPLPGPAAMRLAAGLATALGEIHGAELVHRDLKPSNVLLAADGPRVIDFGVARATDGGTSELTHTGWLVGSPGYMSPEQAESKALTPASDVFSLGAVLYLACTGIDPFMGASTPATLYNVVHSEPDLAPLPEPLRDVVEACIAKAPGERPTPAEVLARIGTVPLAARPWPEPVYELIARQDAAVAAAMENTVAVTEQLPVVPPAPGQWPAPSASGQPSAPTQAAPTQAAAQWPPPANPQPTSTATPYPPSVAESPTQPGLRRRRTLASVGGAAAVAAIGVAVALLMDDHSPAASSASPPASSAADSVPSSGTSSEDATTPDSSTPESSSEAMTSSSSSAQPPSSESASSSSVEPPPPPATTSTHSSAPSCPTNQQAFALAKQLNAGSLPSDAGISVLKCDGGWAVARLTSASVGNAKVVYALQDGAWKAVDLGSDVCSGPVSAAPADVRGAVNC